jgi:hypothetical protein
MSTITTVLQRVDITDVRQIVVTEIVDDAGAKLRLLRIFGDPVVNGAPMLLFEVATRSASADDLKILTPAFDF